MSACLVLMRSCSSVSFLWMPLMLIWSMFRCLFWLSVWCGLAVAGDGERVIVGVGGAGSPVVTGGVEQVFVGVGGVSVCGVVEKVLVGVGVVFV